MQYVGISCNICVQCLFKKMNTPKTLVQAESNLNSLKNETAAGGK